MNYVHKALLDLDAKLVMNIHNTGESIITDNQKENAQYVLMDLVKFSL